MARVIQVRDVPDEVHDALTQEARAQGISLTAFVRRELDELARRAQLVHHNAHVIRDTQLKVSAGVDREAILAVVHEGRRD